MSGEKLEPKFPKNYTIQYYVEGMGCPIRSEIWACISPGNPELACMYSWKDGIMDHGNESVYGEVFLASLEAMAFFENDMEKLINIGLSHIPGTSKCGLTEYSYTLSMSPTSSSDRLGNTNLYQKQQAVGNNRINYI
jgi:hypothetical protein